MTDGEVGPVFTRVLIFSILLALLGCGSNEPIQVKGGAMNPSSKASPVDYVIQPGDELGVKFFYMPELNESVTVRPDGKISLQLLDEVVAAGLTPAQLDDLLTRLYAKELRDPEMTVIVRSFAGRQVFVGGEVGNPGLVGLTQGMTPLQAVINAGGFRETAKPEGVIVIRRGPDSQPIPISVDLKKELDSENRQPALELQPYDIVYVPKTFIAEADKFVRQYVQELLLFQGTSMSFWYGIHDPSTTN